MTTPERSEQDRTSPSKSRAPANVLLVVFLLALVAWNLPGTRLHEALSPALRPIMNATGLSQDLGFFAPDPRQEAFGLYARVKLSDGTTARWEIPSGDRIIGSFRYYRWVKWLEFVAQDPWERFLWAPAARWIARTEAQRGHAVREVVLIRRLRHLTPPGAPPNPWREEEIYRLAVSDTP